MIQEYSLISRRRAQAWGYDLVIAAAIFTIALVFFYFYTINNSRETEEVFQKMFSEGDLIGSFILSEGYPENWNPSNVVSIGLLSRGEINETKLESLYSLTLSDYNQTKKLFNTKYNYYFSLEGKNFSINSQPVSGLGENYNNHECQNLIKLTRFVIYQRAPATLNLFVWN